VLGFTPTLGQSGVATIAIAITTTTASQATLQITIAHHGTMPNNLDLVTTLVNLSPQQLIVIITNIPSTIIVPTFADPMGNFCKFLSWNFWSRVLKFFCSSPPSFSRRMKPSKCFT